MTTREHQALVAEVMTLLNAGTPITKTVQQVTVNHPELKKPAIITACVEAGIKESTCNINYSYARKHNPTLSDQATPIVKRSPTKNAEVVVKKFKTTKAGMPRVGSTINFRYTGEQAKHDRMIGQVIKGMVKTIRGNEIVVVPEHHKANGLTTWIFQSAIQKESV